MPWFLGPSPASSARDVAGPVTLRCSAMGKAAGRRQLRLSVHPALGRPYGGAAVAKSALDVSSPVAKASAAPLIRATERNEQQLTQLSRLRPARAMAGLGQRPPRERSMQCRVRVRKLKFEGALPRHSDYRSDRYPSGRRRRPGEGEEGDGSARAARRAGAVPSTARETPKQQA